MKCKCHVANLVAYNYDICIVAWFTILQVGRILLLKFPPYFELILRFLCKLSAARLDIDAAADTDAARDALAL